MAATTGPGPPIGGPAVLAIAGFAAALFGVYWDDAWHTDRGRDDLFSPPHLALYAGVAVAVGVVIWWAWRFRFESWRSVASGPLGLAVVGAVATLGSAPVDDWWHQAFGRDAVLWSPPHLLALVGTIALGSGVLLVASRHSVGAGRYLTNGVVVAAGAGVIGGWQVLVLEYDTDVAQFSALWYLPVLAVGLSAATLTIQQAAGERIAWPALQASAAYSVAMLAVIAVLELLRSSTPIVPAVVPAAIAADLSRRRGWSVPTRSLAFVGTVFAVYVPYLAVIPGGVAPTIGEAAVGAVVAVGAVAATIVVFDPSARWPKRLPLTAGMPVVVTLVGVWSAGPALAHDPGQGVEVGGIELMASVDGESVVITAVPTDPVPKAVPVRVVARRAGRTLEGPLAAVDQAWVGGVELDQDGRWFVYVEARRGGDDLEAWLPVTGGGVTVVTHQTSLYIRPSPEGSSLARTTVGAVLVVLSIVIVGRVASTVRQASPKTTSGPAFES